MNIRDAVIALLLTEVVEVAVALLLEYRGPRQIIAVPGKHVHESQR
jgi:hypothetical protein